MVVENELGVVMLNIVGETVFLIASENSCCASVALNKLLLDVEIARQINFHLLQESVRLLAKDIKLVELGF